MITTSQAADLTGVRYETIRNWLKKGLLADSHGQSGKWRQYSPADLYRLQLVRDGLAAGVDLETRVDAANDGELISQIQRDSRGTTYLLIWTAAPVAQFMLAPESALPGEIARNDTPVTVVDLGQVRRTVDNKLSASGLAA